MKHLYTGFSVLTALLMLLSGCQWTSKKNKVTTTNPDSIVTIDTSMISILFPNKNDVLTGGDGAISIPIDDEKSYWLWGDSFWGEVKDNQRSIHTPLVMGNTWQIVDGAGAQSIINGTPKHPKPLLEIGNVKGHPAMLWPLHGFVKNNIVHVFMSVIVKTGNGTWDFYWDSNRYYRLKYPELTVVDVEEMLPAKISGAHFGFGFYEHNGYYYTYGTKPDGFSAPVHVARAQLINDKLQKWEVFDGTAWVSEASKSVAMQGVDIAVSEQFSVFFCEDKFILLAQDRFKPDIYTYVADKPEGPWYNKNFIYHEPEAVDTTVFLYNAMAHPQYDENGKLLVSYCVNAKNIPDLFSDASIYKPRFIRVPYSLIFN